MSLLEINVTSLRVTHPPCRLGECIESGFSQPLFPFTSLFRSPGESHSDTESR